MFFVDRSVIESSAWRWPWESLHTVTRRRSCRLVKLGENSKVYRPK